MFLNRLIQTFQLIDTTGPQPNTEKFILYAESDFYSSKENMLLVIISKGRLSPF